MVIMSDGNGSLHARTFRFRAGGKKSRRARVEGIDKEDLDWKITFTAGDGECALDIHRHSCE